MLDRFKKYISDKHLFTYRHKLLLAVSGGVDSVVLTHLCHIAGFEFAIAHCNFGLREKESDSDEKFVKNMAAKFNVPFHVVRFSTQDFADKQNISIQMAARQLRYQWFEEIRIANKYDHIVIAHHNDDAMETFLINLVRGTGISGLLGIPVKRDKIVRPLLFSSRANIEEYASQNNLHFREDSSNASNKYIRNKLRHKVIPVLKEINPNLEETISKDIARLLQVEQVYREAIDQKLKMLKVRKGINAVEIDIKKILAINPVEVYIYELLRPYGFNETGCSDVLIAITGNVSGQQFFSSTHRVVKDRSRLIITVSSISDQQKFIIKANLKVIKAPLALIISKKKAASYRITRSSKTAAIDLDKLQFPLIIRKWQKGDAFRPLGMKEKKKLSDFFVDNKFSLIDKENTWLLLSGNDIVWVMGHRLDDRYKVTDRTKVVYELFMKPD